MVVIIMRNMYLAIAMGQAHCAFNALFFLIIISVIIECYYSYFTKHYMRLGGRVTCQSLPA